MSRLNRHQDIELGVGGTLYWDAPEGRPDSITSVQVFYHGTGDDGTAESATTGSASVDSAATTFDTAASGAGQANERLCNLSATTGFVNGREYLATNGEGEREWVEAVEIDSGASITARNPLENVYGITEAFESTRISIALDSTWVADTNNLSDPHNSNPEYRVRWKYVVDSVTYVHDSYFDLVRYKGAHSVTSQMLEAKFPMFRDMLTSYHREDAGDLILDQAYREVEADLAASDIDTSIVRSEDKTNHLTVLRFGVLLYQDDPGILFERRMGEYQAYLDQHFRVVNRTPLQTDTTGAGTEKPSARVWRR